MPRKAKSVPADPLGALVASAMRLAAADGWRQLTVPAIARAAGLPAAEAYRLAPAGRIDLLRALLRNAVETAAGTVPAPEDEAPVRDRVFDATMAFFEALMPHREGLRVVIREAAGDADMLRLAGPASDAARALLDLAGVDASGVRGTARVLGLAGIIALTARVWIDDTDGLPRTMADLDRRLRRVEGLAQRFG